MDQDERLEIRLPSELKVRLENQAEQEFTSRSEIVRRALLSYFESGTQKDIPSQEQ